MADRLVRAGILLRPASRAVPVVDVTVVVPARSTTRQVQRVIEQLPDDVDVVVVDDGSSPALEPSLERRGRLTVLRHNVSCGPAAARNAGARATATSWVAFIDSDVTPGEECLGMLLSHATDDVVAIAPRVVCGPGGRRVAGLVERWSGALDLGATPSDVGPGRRVSFVPTAMLLVRRSAFELAGGFDERMHVGEDVDLVWRLLELGRVRYEPDVVCTHKPRSSALAVLRRRFEYGTSAAALEQRHPGAIRHVDVSLWSFVPWLIGLLVHPAAGLAAAAVTTGMAPWGLRELPAAEARLLAFRGHLLSAAGLGRYLARPLWPLTVLAMMLCPRRRKVILGAVLIGTADSVRRWVTLDRLDPPTAAAAAKVVTSSALDDVAYSTGIWVASVRARSCATLLPRIRDLPVRGRS